MTSKELAGIDLNSWFDSWEEGPIPLCDVIHMVLRGIPPNQFHTSYVDPATGHRATLSYQRFLELQLAAQSGESAAADRA